MDFLPDTPKCFRMHMGLWAVQPLWFTQAVHAALANMIPLQVATPDAPSPETDAFVTDDGILVGAIHGHLTKGSSKFGGVSTVQTRRILREGARDTSVRAALLHIDSPGGHVDGVHELSEDVRAFGAKKPIHGHIEDLGASAALWASAYVQRLSINTPGEMGSIGAFAVLHDVSGAMEREGIRVIRVASGPLKGAGAGGTPISDDVIAEVQKSVDRVHGLFTHALARGRGFNIATMRAIADGRMFGAQEALSLGLVDAVEPFDTALDRVRRVVRNQRTAPQQAALASVKALRLTRNSCSPHPSEDGNAADRERTA